MGDLSSQGNRASRDVFACPPRAALFKLAHYQAVIGRRQENQRLGELQRGTGPLQNPLFLANVTKPSEIVAKRLWLIPLTQAFLDVVSEQWRA